MREKKRGGEKEGEDELKEINSCGSLLPLASQVDRARAWRRRAIAYVIT